jgi:hypothetical protein
MRARWQGRRGPRWGVNVNYSQWRAHGRSMQPLFSLREDRRRFRQH